MWLPDTPVGALIRWLRWGGVCSEETSETLGETNRSGQKCCEVRSGLGLKVSLIFSFAFDEDGALMTSTVMGEQPLFTTPTWGDHSWE